MEEILPDLRYREVKCTDCDNKAQVYDHREYSKPLEVDPVCKSCNMKRGPAIEVLNLTAAYYRLEQKKIPPVR